MCVCVCVCVCTCVVCSSDLVLQILPSYQQDATGPLIESVLTQRYEDHNNSTSTGPPSKKQKPWDILLSCIQCMPTRKCP